MSTKRIRPLWTVCFENRRKLQQTLRRYNDLPNNTTRTSWDVPGPISRLLHQYLTTILRTQRTTSQNGFWQRYKFHRSRKRTQQTLRRWCYTLILRQPSDLMDIQPCLCFSFRRCMGTTHKISQRLVLCHHKKPDSNRRHSTPFFAKLNTSWTQDPSLQFHHRPKMLKPSHQIIFFSGERMPPCHFYKPNSRQHSVDNGNLPNNSQSIFGNDCWRSLFQHYCQDNDGQRRRRLSK